MKYIISTVPGEIPIDLSLERLGFDIVGTIERTECPDEHPLHYGVLAMEVETGRFVQATGGCTYPLDQQAVKSILGFTGLNCRVEKPTYSPLALHCKDHQRLYNYAVSEVVKSMPLAPKDTPRFLS